MNMRNLIVFSLLSLFMGLFLVLAFSLAGSGGVPQSMGVNNSFGEIKIKRMVAPDFSLDLYDDREIRLSELRGNVVVLAFWSSWCSPCRKEAAVLAEVYLEYRDKGVVFLGISIWDRDEDALAHIEEFDVQYPSGPDSKGEILVEYGVTGIPEKVFIDQRGNKVRKFTGPSTKDELVAILDDMLGSGY